LIKILLEILSTIFYYHEITGPNPKKMQSIKVLVRLIDASWYTSPDFRGGTTEVLIQNKTHDPTPFIYFGYKSRDFLDASTLLITS